MHSYFDLEVSGHRTAVATSSAGQDQHAAHTRKVRHNLGAKRLEDRDNATDTESGQAQNCLRKM